ncbi:hypothetical protein E2C01_080845 [Portunus trituberculatus]|uniref:Uncharacterized protein n=1 Tax=Portunus trituberculatus TaxID=210409 RepID=A0A5B7IUG5_PORTR|nr:hypothetical protein [Portunus trituberculatus]
MLSHSSELKRRPAGATSGSPVGVLAVWGTLGDEGRAPTTGEGRGALPTSRDREPSAAAAATRARRRSTCGGRGEVVRQRQGKRGVCRYPQRLCRCAHTLTENIWTGTGRGGKVSGTRQWCVTLAFIVRGLMWRRRGGCRCRGEELVVSRDRWRRAFIPTRLGWLDACSGFISKQGNR